MTEIIFKEGTMDLKLSCNLYVSQYMSAYQFKLMRRDSGKRKWMDIEGYERGYRAETEMEDILKYLSMEQVLEVAEMEYRKYSPSKLLSKKVELKTI